MWFWKCEKCNVGIEKMDQNGIIMCPNCNGVACLKRISKKEWKRLDIAIIGD